ncbi:hypothetical protein Rhopal_001816-T1 [Rhodotorula paludigena]|uniref:Uncharacterized protein n=1 Tax=Rhodotorula paludigena TaxID=86838 RepID=A0AAV5GH27_9BASI|nr:hypothetical protein Rhopal_001816-T1 [Rhodotorula paludigena]
MPLRHLDVSVRAAVRLPDMHAIERAIEHAPIIPMMPDAFGARSTAASFPVLQPAKAYSTVADPQTHLGGGPSSTGNAAK